MNKLVVGFHASLPEVLERLVELELSIKVTVILSLSSSPSAVCSFLVIQSWLSDSAGYSCSDIPEERKCTSNNRQQQYQKKFNSLIKVETA